MSNLPDGRYFILLATSSAPLPLPVGVDLEGSTPPIIVGGKNCIVSPSFSFSTNGTCMLYPVPMTLLTFLLDGLVC